jgi:hypothetical protein
MFFFLYLSPAITDGPAVVSVWVGGLVFIGFSAICAPVRSFLGSPASPLLPQVGDHATNAADYPEIGRP